MLFIDKTSNYSIDETKFNLIVTSIQYKNEKTIIEFSGKETLICHYKGTFPYKLGDKVEVIGYLKEANKNTIPNLFNYKKYLYYNDIHYLLNIEKVTLIKKNSNLIFKIKNYLIKRIESINIKKEYLYAFVLGKTSYINSEIRDAYQFIGVSHLLAIGTSSITLISCLLSYIFYKCKLNDYLYILLTSIFVIIYIILTSFSVSIVRGGLALILTYIVKKMKLNISYQNIIIFIASISLLYNPYYIFDLGFQYSYLISLVLIIYNKIIKGNYLQKLLKVSMIAYLVSIPINIYNNFEINLLSIVFNLLYVPLVNLVIFPLSLLTIIFPFFSIFFKIIINITEQITLLFKDIKLFTIILAKPNITIILLYYLIIFFVLNGITKHKYFRVLLLIVVMLIHYNINYIQKKDSIMFVDVNQGDSIIIRNSAKVSLIDTGGSYSYNYSNSIIDYLKSIGIRKIEHLILTHGDYDHMGEAINLVNNFKVENVIFNCGDFNELEEELISVLDKKKIKYYSCIKELNIDSSKLYFLNNKDYGNENDNSIVLYTKINNKKFLFMGDASVKTEKDIMDKYNLKDIDVIKVGHHGSKTSSSEDFINKINPKYSLISVGKNNRYGHPSKETLEVLDKTKIYRTDIDGSVMFEFNKDKLEISTCPP